MWLDGIERQKNMHAEVIAEMLNARAGLVVESDGISFTAEDVLGKGDRAKRKRQQMRNRLHDFRDSGKIAKGEGVPDWALQVAELARERQKVN